MSDDTHYADGVADIVVVGPTARIRFYVLQPGKDGKAQPSPASAFTVVMPVEQVAQLGEKLPELTQKLLDSGRLKKRAPAAKTN